MGTESLEKEIEEEFCEVGIDIEGNLVILQRLESMCSTYNLTASDLLARWFTYVAIEGERELSADVLDDFCKYVAKIGLSKKRREKTPSSDSHPIMLTKKTLDANVMELEEEEDMLLGYATTPDSKGAGKRAHTTPEGFGNKRMITLVRKPHAPFSPGSFSPYTGAAASSKYEGRKTKGELAASFYFSGGKPSKWHGTRENVEIKSYCEKSNLTTPYKYMYEKLDDRADVLDNIMNSLSDSMSAIYDHGDFKRITHTFKEEISCFGRICCDSMGKLNAKSMLIEGDKLLAKGERVNFDVSQVSSFSAFPGQVVFAKGMRQMDRFVAAEIHDGVRLPFNATINKDQSINKAAFTVYIACGPFVLSDTLSHAPLGDFLSVIESERPDVIIMLGPFIDSRMPAIEKAEVDFSFEEKFQEFRDLITSAAVSAGSKVVFVPSQRDAHHHYVYPQPPFKCPGNYFKETAYFVSDPATLSFNDVVFGVTSTDILFHLGSEEAFSFSAGASDRLGRICRHLLKQQSYYPLQPPSEEVNIDYLHFEKYALMHATPDVLIVPSDLRFFIKNVDGCLCINPGRLVKGQTGGTYARLHVVPKKVPNEDTSIAISESSVEIIKV